MKLPGIKKNIKFIFFFMLFIVFFNKLAASDESLPPIVDFYAEYIRYTEDKIVARGNVTAINLDVSIRADYVEVNLKDKILIASGNVTVDYKGDKICGSFLTYNLDTQFAVMNDIYGIIKNLGKESSTSGGKLFFWAKEIKRMPDKAILSNVKATTCDLAEPETHYYIKSKEIIIYPEDKMVAKDASFYLNSKKAFTAPSIVYSVRPKDSRQRLQTYIPKIGQNDIDGLSVKESLNYLFGKGSYGIIHLDYFSKTGMGKGIEHFMDFGSKGQGSVHYYSLDSKMPATSRHEYSASFNYLLPMDINLSYAYSSSQYQFPDQQSYPIKNSFFSLSRTHDRSSFNISSSLYNTGFNLNQGYNFYHTYNISPSLKSYLYFDYSKNSSSEKETYNAHPIFRLYNQGKFFDTDFSFEKTSGTLESGIEREPELTLLSHKIPFGPLDLQLTGSYGTLREKPQTEKFNRTYLEFALPYKIFKLSKNSYFDSYSSIYKLWYNNGSSQKVLINKTGLFGQLSSSLAARFDFFYQNPNGEPALELDNLKYYKLFLGSLNIFDKEKYYLTLGTAYDLSSSQYQDLLCRINLTPWKLWNINLGTNYNINTGRWRNLDAQLDINITKTLNIRYWCEYEHENKRMITQDYSIIKDFHCWETRITYRGFSNQWWFDVVLKAFSSEDVTIGANQTKPILPEEGWQRF